MQPTKFKMSDFGYEAKKKDVGGKYQTSVYSLLKCILKKSISFIQNYPFGVVETKTME